MRAINDRGAIKRIQLMLQLDTLRPVSYIFRQVNFNRLSGLYKLTLSGAN